MNRRKSKPTKRATVNPPTRPVVTFDPWLHEECFRIAWQDGMARDAASNCVTLQNVAYAAYQRGFDAGALAERNAAIDEAGRK